MFLILFSERGKLQSNICFLLYNKNNYYIMEIILLLFLVCTQIHGEKITVQKKMFIYTLCVCFLYFKIFCVDIYDFYNQSKFIKLFDKLN